MKIVHTGDWHIGKTIRGRHRSGEYRQLLEELKEFLREENVDVLLVAGDIFDAATPSAESEDIVYNFFHDVSLLGVKTIVIAGNHDSGLRFEAIAGIMALARVYISGFYGQSNGRTRIKVHSRDGKEFVNVHLVPFISERTFIRAEDLAKKDATDTTFRYSKGMSQILHTIGDAFLPDEANIVMGHLLMHGARPGGGERRLYLGENYAVHPEHIPDNIDYFALGHVHMFQQIQGPSPIYYCGSSVQLDFGEMDHEKGFLYLDTKTRLWEPSFVPFKKGKKLCEIKGTIEEITALLSNDPTLKDAYLKITVKTDSSPLGLSHKIKKDFPNAVDIRREYVSKEKEIPLLETSQWLPDLYQGFHQKQYEKPAGLEIMKELHRLYEECSQKKGYPVDTGHGS